MHSRRSFLGALAAPTALGLLAPAPLAPSAFARMRALFAGPACADPARLASDDALWFEVSQAFTVDRSVVNLNNGGVSPAPASVQRAHKQLLDFSNELPPHNLWRVLDPRVEGVRQQLASLFGCEAEEIAVTRNASESLQTVQFGLDLEPGDEVLASDQDYPRMLNTFRQRERRDGLVLRTVKLPVPVQDADEVVRRYAEGINERTRLILCSHVVYLTGSILPVREIVRLGRARGIPVLVDGAHAFAQFPFKRDDLECDYYGTSLHKWLFAPHGTGMLHVRRERIADLWPLMAAPETRAGDVRKFEEIGTHPAAGYVATAEAIAFHSALGPERKAARLRHLKLSWAERLGQNDRTRFATSLDAEHSCGFATVRFEGLDTKALQRHLWSAHKIFTVAVTHEDFEGLRISPSVYTLPAELERFCGVIETALEQGLPD